DQFEVEYPAESAGHVYERRAVQHHDGRRSVWDDGLHGAAWDWRRSVEAGVDPDAVWAARSEPFASGEDSGAKFGAWSVYDHGEFTDYEDVGIRLGEGGGLGEVDVFESGIAPV